MTVLEEAGQELRVRDIHERVESLFGETVARSSVKDCLWDGCRRKTPLFEYCGTKGY
jgi:hypothetical protein